jgi:hypothetical protein
MREMKRCDRFQNEGRQAGPHSSPHKSAAVERETAHRLEVGASEARRRVVWLSHNFVSCSCGLRCVGFGWASWVCE